MWARTDLFYKGYIRPKDYTESVSFEAKDSGHYGSILMVMYVRKSKYDEMVVMFSTRSNATASLLRDKWVNKTQPEIFMSSYEVSNGAYRLKMVNGHYAEDIPANHEHYEHGGIDVTCKSRNVQDIITIFESVNNIVPLSLPSSQIVKAVDDLLARLPKQTPVEGFGLFDASRAKESDEIKTPAIIKKFGSKL